MPLQIKAGEQLAASGTYGAFAGLSADLEADGHPPVLVVSGDRDPAYQERIWYARMVPVADVNGRRTYGPVKRWRGINWIRISSAGDVAIPGTSPHEAKRAGDLGYPYNNRYTTAHARAVVLAPRHGVKWTGVNFGEDWHFENLGPLGVIGSPAGSGGNAYEEDDVTFTDEDRADLKSVAMALGALGLAGLPADQRWTDNVMDNTRKILNEVRGVPLALRDIEAQVNGVPGVLAALAAQIAAIPSGGNASVDVGALASALRESLGAEIADELSKRLAG